MIVLIVEDEPLIAMAMQMLVEDEGWTVLGPFASVQQAKSAIEAGAAFDVALLDCWLGKQAIWEVADLVADKRVPFAFTSGRSEREIEPRFAGRPVFVKPVDEAQVRNFLKAAAAKA